MIDCYNYLKQENLGTRILSQVHDEIMFEVPHDEESWVPFKMLEIMEEKRIIDTFCLLIFHEVIQVGRKKKNMIKKLVYGPLSMIF